MSYVLVFQPDTARYVAHASGCSCAIERTTGKARRHVIPRTFDSLDAARQYANADEREKGGDKANFKIAPCTRERNSIGSRYVSGRGSVQRLYERFRGAVVRRVLRTGIKLGSKWLTRPGAVNILIPDELALIGRVNAIEYDCVRDGKLVKARHVFSPGSRPQFAVGACRGQLFLLGSAYRFTDRGIVDYDTQGRPIDYNEKTGVIKALKD